MPLPTPPLLVISDRSQARRPVLEVAAAAFAGGCRWFSLREKDLPPDERRALLRELLALGQRWDATVTIHDDIDAAIIAGAAGVHLPGGADPAAARARLPHGLIGASAHGAAEATSLLAAGADYVTISPVFLTGSKPGHGPALGLDGLAAAVTASGGPVVALAGINAATAAACLAAGAVGVAVMGEVMRAADPEATVRALVDAMNGASASRRKPGPTRQPLSS
jgi:thiamine-phosphate pyrophosphorylase